MSLAPLSYGCDLAMSWPRGSRAMGTTESPVKERSGGAHDASVASRTRDTSSGSEPLEAVRQSMCSASTLGAAQHLSRLWLALGASLQGLSVHYMRATHSIFSKAQAPKGLRVESWPVPHLNQRLSQFAGLLRHPTASNPAGSRPGKDFRIYFSTSVRSWCSRKCFTKAPTHEIRS